MIDRCQFLPAGALDGDFPFPLSESCSVPSTRMVYLLASMAGEGESVLEIGTGSGYQTAVLAERFKQVVSLEVQPIAGIAEKLPSNVALIRADGEYYSTGETFNAIVVTFAARQIQPTWVEQLKLGGRIVIPLEAGSSCRISLYEKTPEGMCLREVFGYAPFCSAIH